MFIVEHKRGFNIVFKYSVFYSLNELKNTSTACAHAPYYAIMPDACSKLCQHNGPVSMYSYTAMLELLSQLMPRFMWPSHTVITLHAITLAQLAQSSRTPPHCTWRECYRTILLHIHIHIWRNFSCCEEICTQSLLLTVTAGFG